MIIFDQNLCVVLKIEKLNLDFTKIAFKPLYTNLFNIVLLAFFLTIGITPIYSQETPKNETVSITELGVKETKLEIDGDSLKKKNNILEDIVKRKVCISL